jgi:hypothetical protein
MIILLKTTFHQARISIHTMKTILFLIMLISPLGALDLHPPLSRLTATEEATIGGIDWKVLYSDDRSSDHYVSPSNASSFLGFINELYARQVTDLGFGKHWVSTLPSFRVTLYDFVADGEEDLGGYYDYDLFALNINGMPTPPDMTNRKVTSHEMFHAIQQRYLDNGGYGRGCSNAWGKVISEGHARCMDDRWYSEFDTFDDLSSFYLKGSSLIFFNDYTDYNFWKIGTSEDTVRGTADDAYPYATAIFWSYLCEQLGNQITPLENGYDWIQRFLLDSENRLKDDRDMDGKICTNDAINDFVRGTGEDFTSMYFDFAICNYARKFNQSLLPYETRYRVSNLVPRYAYRDEQEVGASGMLMNYGNVPVHSSTSATSASWLAQSLMANSAKYYEWNISNSLDTQTCEIMGVRATCGETVNLAILGITKSGKISEILKFSGKEAARSFLISNKPMVDPVCRIAVVAVAPDENVSGLDIRFERGPATLQIVRPFGPTRPAYPGPYNNPGRFLTRVMVTGPASLKPEYFGNLSVQGLTAGDFSILVGAAPSTIVSSGYVGGEYWIEANAPLQSANGFKDLTVSLCEGGISANNSNALIYGEYTFRHTVCMDLSGSMVNPPEKLEAAKQAAMFYIDAVRDNDRLGLSSFNGNSSEPDTDAILYGGSLMPANWLSRGLLKVGVNGFTASGLTSIGDGLWVSQNGIDADTTAAPVVDTIMLLSDGRQNEDRYWQSGSTVYQRFLGGGTYGPGNDTIINALSFGAEADTNLMQSIAASTAGDYGHIDVIEPTRTRSTVDPRYRMYLDMAAGHLSGIERTEGLSRLAYEETTVNSSSTATLTLKPGASTIENAIVSLFWYGVTNPLSVTVKDSSGSVIDSTRAILLPQNYSNGEKHQIQRLTVPVSGGNFTVTITNPNTSACRVFATISGKPQNDVTCRVAFASYLRSSLGSREDLVRQRFEIGQPVTILAFLTDAAGPIKGASLTTRILLPNGIVACGPMELNDDGRSGDGNANDGVYGAIFRQTLWGQSNGTDIDSGQVAPLREASGLYRVSVTAEGKSNDGTSFSRLRQSAFAVYKEFAGQSNIDADADGLPYSWELSQGTNPSLFDASQDPDEDGLSNLLEYQNGTLALQADSDGGGEADGSEVTGGRCPLSPLDDAIKFSNHLYVLTPDEVGDLDDNPFAANTNYLHLTRIRSFNLIEIQRSLSSTGPWSTIVSTNPQTEISNVRPDGGLTPGIRYYYRARGTNTATGAISKWTEVASGVPYSNAQLNKPAGKLKLNNGNPKTDQLKLKAKIVTHPDVGHYRISHNPLTVSDPWIPYEGKPINYLLPSATGSGMITLYAEVKNTDGLISDTFTDTILFDTSTAANADNDGDGISDANEIDYGTDPYSADTDGDGLADGVEIGLGLMPHIADTDGDKLSDGMETSAGTNPKSRDSDSDGQNDWVETILVASDPLNATDRFETMGATALPNGTIRIRFQSQVGTNYYFEESSDLVNFSRLDIKAAGTGGVMNMDLPAKAAVAVPSKRFVRIRPAKY